MKKPVNADNKKAPLSGHSPVLPQRVLDQFSHDQLSKAAMGLSPIAMALAFSDWAMHLAVSPGRQMELAVRAQELLGNVIRKSLESAASDEEPMEPDSRFSDPAWSNWPYNLLRDTFEAADAWWRDAAEVEGMGRHNYQLVSFFARQWMDALAPSNWAPSNPEALKLGLQTGGESWRDGFLHMFHDMRQLALASSSKASGLLKPLPYEVGKDVAATPGKVVYRDDLFELIQYAPTTVTVAAEPLLIVPSNIMKYYILDLSRRNSMVRYLVAQGFTVFMISWRNPDASCRDFGMNNYIEAVMQAMRVARKQAAAPHIHAAGYCLGGTLLSIVASVLGGAKPESAKTPMPLPKLASVTLLAAQVDFSEPGELGIFIDHDQIKTVREEMARTGYFPGHLMAAAFQFLRAKDLIWTRNTQRYLMGKEEGGNDLMSWNADTTHLPERMHNEYLDSMYLNNALAAGHYRVGNKVVALRDMKMPLMVVGTERDHVSPWRSVYKVRLLTDADTAFILANGGHNAGIVSEPGHPHRSYQMAESKAGDAWVDQDTWAATAKRHEGSWWEAWSAWLQRQGSGKVKARAIPAKSAICDAPGEYVMVRYVD